VAGLALVYYFRPQWLAKKGEPLAEEKKHEFKKMGIRLMAIASLLGIPTGVGFLFFVLLKNSR
jgi:hypothetical protein